MDYVSGNYQAPSSPWPQESSSHHPLGQSVYDQAHALCAWYCSWVENPSKHPQTFEYLSRIMRIAFVSLSQGHYLTTGEENKAKGTLEALGRNLYAGNTRHEQIPDILLGAINDLTESNPKARLVDHTTQLEYLICIRPGQSEEVQAECKKLLDGIVEQINPDLPDINAQAVAQGLSQILQNPATVKNFQEAIHSAISGWLV